MSISPSGCSAAERPGRLRNGSSGHRVDQVVYGVGGLPKYEIGSAPRQSFILFILLHICSLRGGRNTSGEIFLARTISTLTSNDSSSCAAPARCLQDGMHPLALWSSVWPSQYGYDVLAGALGLGQSPCPSQKTG